MGQRGRNGQVGGGGKEIGTGKVSPVDKGVWEEAVRENAHKEIVGSRNRCKKGVCAKEGEGVSVVKGRKRRDEGICEGTVAEGLHLAVEVTANDAGVLCREEGWCKTTDISMSGQSKIITYCP